MRKLIENICLVVEIISELSKYGFFTGLAFRRAVIVWRLRGVECGERSICGADVHIANRHNLAIGSDVMITDRILISCAAPVSIGNRVMIGPSTVIHTTTHDLLTKIPVHHGITIEDGVWIAASVTITCGVVIGENSVVAAGSVVTKTIPKNVVAAGVPAVVVKELDEIDVEKTRFRQSDWLSRFK